MGYDLCSRLFMTGIVLLAIGVPLCAVLSQTRRPLQYALWLPTAGIAAVLVGAVGMIWSAP